MALVGRRSLAGSPGPLEALCHGHSQRKTVCDSPVSLPHLPGHWTASSRGLKYVWGAMRPAALCAPPDRAPLFSETRRASAGPVRRIAKMSVSRPLCKQCGTGSCSPHSGPHLPNNRGRAR